MARHKVLQDFDQKVQRKRRRTSEHKSWTDLVDTSWVLLTTLMERPRLGYYLTRLDYLNDKRRQERWVCNRVSDNIRRGLFEEGYDDEEKATLSLLGERRGRCFQTIENECALLGFDWQRHATNIYAGAVQVSDEYHLPAPVGMPPCAAIDVLILLHLPNLKTLE